LPRVLKKKSLKRKGREFNQQCPMKKRKSQKELNESRKIQLFKERITIFLRHLIWM
jgi:hypothetical protein